jgi:hypothetical protein
VLWASAGGGDPNDIRGGVVFDTAGNLYGTSRIGGVGCGTAFELASNSDGSWSEINLDDLLRRQWRWITSNGRHDHRHRR